MNDYKLPRRVMAVVLCIVMVLGMLTVSVAAETLTDGTGGEAAPFEPLPETMTEQVADLDLPSEALDLINPEDLLQETAVKGVITAFEELSEEQRWQNTSVPIFPETLACTVEGQTVSIPVTWESDHDYDPDSPESGLYVFTAKPDGDFVIDAGTQALHITVYIPAGKRMMLRMMGEGNSTSPLEITTVAQLSEIALLVNAGRLETFLFNDSNAVVSLKLMNDLELSSYGERWNYGEGWNPIGSTTYPFKGSFDGNNHEITGLFIKQTWNSIGLFGSLESGKVENLKLEKVRITGNDAVGGIAGYVDASSEVTNCSVTGTVSGTGPYVGGVVGMVNGSSVTNCSAEGNVSGISQFVGGVAGFIDHNGSVANCYITATVSGKSEVGGVVGYVQSGSVANCYATGRISSIENRAGGIAGIVAGKVKNCYATANITGSRFVGGVAGSVIDGSVKDCAALNGSVSGAADVGRVVGSIEAAALSGNAAFSGMVVKINHADQSISGGLGTDINGEDIHSVRINEDGTIGGRFADGGGWTTENGKLPILTNVGNLQEAAMPAHLAGGSNSYFLGEGTSDDPYQISTAEQLSKLAELVNESAEGTFYGGKCYKLTSDLDLSGYGENWNNNEGWVSIGLATKPFRGTFDGNGKNIDGLFINRTVQISGLFGCMNGGTVKNLNLVEVRIAGGTYVGGAVGYSDGSSVENCNVTGTVTGVSGVGGVAGCENRSLLSGCYFAGSVSGTDGDIGGVVGTAYGGVTNCHAASKVSSTNGNVGGVVGTAYGSVTNCHATGKVSGTRGDVGGVVGAAYDSVTNCYAISLVSGTAGSIGGVAGSVLGSAENCYATGSVSGTDSNVGGVAGLVSYSSVVSNCYATGKGAGKGADCKVGGVAGLVYGGSVTNCYATGNLTGAGAGEGSMVGGIAGEVYGGSVTACIALNGSICGPADVGRIAGGNAYGTLSGNVAFSGMVVKVNDSEESISGGSADNLQGEDIIAAAIKMGGNIRGLFSDWDGWITEYDKLPILKNAGGTQNTDMPPHISGGSDAYFLGEGTSEDPYIISSAEQLAKLAELVNSPATSADYGRKVYKLNNDLDLSAYGKNWNNNEGWIPIGVNTYPFEGIFDGNGKSITGLFINRMEKGTGLFGYLYGGMVKNLGLQRVKVSGSSDVGGIAGVVRNGGSIKYCYVSGWVAGDSVGTGSIAGSIDGFYDEDNRIENCYATSTVRGMNGVGGIAGSILRGYLKNCYAVGTVSGFGKNIGGVAGDCMIGSVTNCAALNPSVSGGRNVGRVIGFADNESILSGNVAFSGMMGGGSGMGAGSHSGTNVSIKQMNTASFWTTADNWDISGWDLSVWKIENGRLPVIQSMSGVLDGGDSLFLTARDIAAADVKLDGGTYTYNGDPIIPSFTIIFDGQRLEKDVDYQVAVADGSTSNGINAGTVTMDVIGIGNFKGTKPGLTFHIEKADGPEAPVLSYTVSGSSFPKTVTISEITGAEYKFNSGSYGSERTYTSNSAESVTLYIRLKETANHNASLASVEIVDTANQNQDAPLGFALSYEGVNDTSYTVTIPETVGAEYCFGGSSWSSTNTKTGCMPGEIISGYKRMAAKPGYNASPATFDSVTLPRFQVKAPTAMPDGGRFSGSQSVTLSCDTKGADIYYTVDGSMPTSGSTLYTGTFTLTTTTTIKAIAVKTGMLDSRELSLTFTRKTGGGGGGGGLSNAAESAVMAITTFEAGPDQPVTAFASVTATDGTSGTASAAIPKQLIYEAIAKAQTEAKAQTDAKTQADAKLKGKTENGVGLSIAISHPENTKVLGILLSQPVLKQLTDAKVQQLEINAKLLTLKLNLEALQELQNQSTGDITITITPVSIRDVRSAHDITISTVNDGRSVNITSLGDGSATITIPYTPGRSEAAGSLYAVFVDDNGKVNRIPESAYHANSRGILFSTHHFSIYGVDYTAPSAKFTDIDAHWGKEDIDYVVGRRLLSGISKTIFSPDTAMTRGMLVMALGRQAGVDEKAYNTTSFIDVSADSVYRSYIEWAYQKSIVQGIGNQQFAPDRKITREQIAMILASYAKATGYTLPLTHNTTTFTDDSGIGSCYHDAVKSMQQAGILLGDSENKFRPKGNATRAEVSAMLCRYIKLTITPATAQGWALNDAGQYLYYKSGKALVGAQNLDGVKYCFNTDGILKTGWVKDGDGWRFYSGKTMVIGFRDLGEEDSSKRYYFQKDGIMVSNKWMEIEGKWYYFYSNGSLARSAKVDGYEVDEDGIRKTNSL